MSSLLLDGTNLEHTVLEVSFSVDKAHIRHIDRSVGIMFSTTYTPLFAQSKNVLHLIDCSAIVPTQWREDASTHMAMQRRVPKDLHIKAHLKRRRRNALPPRQLAAFVNMHESQSSSNDPTKCPLCPESVTPGSRYWRHVGKHQEQLALFALPLHLSQNDEGEGDEDERTDVDEAQLKDNISDSPASGSDQPDLRSSPVINPSSYEDLDTRLRILLRQDSSKERFERLQEHVHSCTECKENEKQDLHGNFLCSYGRPIQQDLTHTLNSGLRTGTSSTANYLYDDSENWIIKELGYSLGRTPVDYEVKDEDIFHEFQKVLPRGPERRKKESKSGS